MHKKLRRISIRRRCTHRRRVTNGHKSLFFFEGGNFSAAWVGVEVATVETGMLAWMLHGLLVPLGASEPGPTANVKVVWASNPARPNETVILKTPPGGSVSGFTS